MADYRNFDQATLDREYAPSSCIEDIKVYLDAYAEESARALAVAETWGGSACNLAYGTADDELLDLFLPASPAGAPLHIYIHGGYWQALSKDDSLFAASMFQDSGSFFAALNYSLAPAATLSEIVDQNRRAICWLYENSDRLGFDRDKMYLSGSSAGAHLVVMMLLTDWSQYDLPVDAIKGACAVSGIYDLEPVRLSYVNESVGMDSLEAADNSPMSKALRNHCPVILAYGDNETAEFKRQTNEYRDALIASGEKVSFSEIAGRNHFDVIMDLADADSWLAQAVLRQMGLT